jgi:uncharacterized protein YjbJ (UPF0337 family)
LWDGAQTLDQAALPFARSACFLRVHNGYTYSNDSKGGTDVSNTDKAKNKAQELSGRAKETAGVASKDRSLEAEGKSDQAKGNLKQAGEKVKDAFK